MRETKRLKEAIHEAILGLESLSFYFVNGSKEDKKIFKEIEEIRRNLFLSAPCSCTGMDRSGIYRMKKKGRARS